MAQKPHVIIYNLILLFYHLSSEQKHTKQVHQLLSDVYPAMFKESVVDGPVPSYSGYGLGGLRGLKGLPERICNLVHL